MQFIIIILLLVSILVKASNSICIGKITTTAVPVVGYQFVHTGFFIIQTAKPNDSSSASTASGTSRRTSGTSRKTTKHMKTSTRKTTIQSDYLLIN